MSEFKETWYVVRYKEDDWNALPEERRAFCIAQWKEKASPHGYTQLVLQLVPDALFPSGEHDKPYIKLQEAIVQEQPELTIITTTVAMISEEAWHKVENDVKARTELVQRARDKALRQTPMGGTYIIRADGRVAEIERGARQ